MPEPIIAGKALVPWAGLRESLFDKLLQLVSVPVLRHGQSPLPWCSQDAATAGAFLIGYSFGGHIAARPALAGPSVAYLILIATPVSPALLGRLRTSERIADLTIHDIPGDPVRAGMPLWQLVAALPRLATQLRRMA